MKLTDEGRRKQNRGSGDKESWIPWHFSSDFPGTGLKGKPRSNMFPPRLLQALSKTELELLYIIEMTPSVEDFKEQYNLPVKETKLIANKLGLKHPLSPDGKSEVMTIDVLVSFKNGEKVAFDVKYFSEELWEDKKKTTRMLEKLQISKIWSESKGIRYVIVTQREIPKILITNIRLLRSHFNYVDDFIDSFKLELQKFDKSFKGTVQEVSNKISKTLNIPNSRGWKIFNHLCSVRLIKPNLHNPFNKNTDFTTILISEP
jgi:hypothetical protein